MINSVMRPAISELRSEESKLNANSIHTTIVIPVYNEEQALPHVLEAILVVVDNGYEVLVVDDGSHDNTRQVAMSFPCRVISHEVNRGKGAAMKTAGQYARGKNIIFIDGDATYPADVIPQVVRQLDRHDIVRCVRDIGRENIPFINRIGNQIFDNLISTMHKVEGSDVLSGLYGLKRGHLLAMQLKSDGFDIETEIMVKARAMSLTQSTIPIVYNERIGEKKLRPIRDGLSIVNRIFHLAVMLNPVLTYILPGALLWLIALAALLLLGRGPVMLATTGLSTHTLIVSAMAFLAGFQMIVFGCLVNLYAVEAGFGTPSRSLSFIAARSPRFGGAIVGIGLMAAGFIWSVILTHSWLSTGLGPFNDTDSLVVALSLIVWGVQLISTVVLLSIFAGLAKSSTDKELIVSSDHISVLSPSEDFDDDEELLERAVGEV